MALINYSNVDIYQDSQLVLKNVNFTVNEGEFIYITGKVGSGKSSLLKSIYAEIPVKEGRATVLDYDVKKLKPKNVPELRRKLGIIFQDFQLLTDRTVEANLRFVLKATGWKNKRDMDQRIKDVLELVGMNTKGYKMPYELSGGEQQRITIARAILNKPKLILADEPTGNLDVETSNRITELLQSISQSGSTVIMITHNMNLLTRYPGKVFKCEDHQFSEVTAPLAFDLSSLDDEIISEDSTDSDDKDCTADASSPSSSSPAFYFSDDDESDNDNEEEKAETEDNKAENLIVAEIQAVADTPLVTEPQTIAEEQATEQTDVQAETKTEQELHPINLDDYDYQPLDITAINDIIQKHEKNEEDGEGEKKSEVID